LSENDKKEENVQERYEEKITNVGTSDKYTCEICHLDFRTKTEYENHGCLN
jgi:hypothetical protein